MYFYTGKSLDGFENAINMLLINNGYEPIEYLDCISLRNCAMSNTDVMSQWFSPMVNTFQSIEHISMALGALKLFKVREICEIGKNDLFLTENNKSFVLGPINKKRLINKIDANFYDGNRNYIYCFFDKGQLIAHEPDGVPYVTLGEKDMESFMKGRRMVYQIFINPDQIIKKPDRKEVLQKWIDSMRTYKNHPDEIANIDYSKIKNLSASNELEWKYGLQNYMIQTYKMINMVLANNKEIEKYSRLFQMYAEEVAKIIIKKENFKFNNVIKKIDNLLEQIITEEIDQ